MYGHHTPRFVQIKNLTTVNDAAGHLGIPARTLHHRKDRAFPKPIRTLGGTHIYDLAEIKAWHYDRERGGQRGLVLREYRRTGSVRAAARAAGIWPERARRWLVKMGEPLPTELRELLKDL